ncbi:hypothetical protein [Pontixanthobacter luteolus]|uniref:hypothetical protein n=1 Tax=Pontixanthobacter luteolus TaxID=295089 RepID=UPI0023024FFA|nr:hypothetical protein [Pontixanthobacter luteolus]
MKNQISSRVLAVSAMLCAFGLAGCAEPAPVTGDTARQSGPIEVAADTDRLVEAFLRSEYPDTATVLYSYGRADLDGVGDDEYLVYAGGPMMCGSGGCNLLVLKTADDGFTKIGSLTVSQLPVGVLSTSTNGMKDLGVSVYGGGQEPGIMKVPFDGAKYASNPTVEPATKVGSIDLVIIPEGELKPVASAE